MFRLTLLSLGAAAATASTPSLRGLQSCTDDDSGFDTYVGTTALNSFITDRTCAGNSNLCSTLTEMSTHCPVTCNACVTTA